MIDKMREEFEQFIIKRDGAIWVTVFGDARSYNEPIERDFGVWKASRESLVIELPIPKELCGPEGSYMEYFEPEQIERCIEGAGLKVKS